MKINKHDAGHMAKMAVTYIYGKNPSKIFLSGTSRLILTNLGFVALKTPTHDSLFK